MLNKRVTLQISSNDLHRLPKPNENPLFFVCNRWAKGWDEVILNQLLAPEYPTLKVLTVSETPDYLGKIKAVLFEKKISAFKKIMRKELDKNNNSTALAMPIHFSKGNLQDPFYQKNLNEFFKTVSDEGYTLVLINIKGLSSLDEFERIWKHWSKTVGNKMLGKIPPEYLPNVEVRISPTIPNDELQAFEKANQLRRFVQSRLFAMQNNVDTDWKYFFKRWLPKGPDAVQEPIAQPVADELLQKEVAVLRESCLVVEQSGFEVFVAQSVHIPNLLREIGRQRELTFRAVKEGTGLALDLDDFDLYYRQLIIWDKKEGRLVGGYRIGCGDEILKQYGVLGFYCATLFRIGEGFQPILPKALELGRSYIVTEYQRKPLPLFLLWKGILHFLLENPHYRYVFGPVSISRQFSDISRGLMVGFLKKHYFDAQLAKHLKPRKPFKVKAQKVDMNLLIDTFGGNLSNLDKFIEFNETHSVRLPVLLKQYIRQNANFVGFNIDPKFSDCLDGFMILDLKNLPAATLENLQRERVQPLHQKAEILKNE